MLCCQKLLTQMATLFRLLYEVQKKELSCQSIQPNKKLYTSIEMDDKILGVYWNKLGYLIGFHNPQLEFHKSLWFRILMLPQIYTEAKINGR